MWTYTCVAHSIFHWLDSFTSMCFNSHLHQYKQKTEKGPVYIQQKRWNNSTVKKENMNPASIILGCISTGWIKSDLALSKCMEVTLRFLCLFLLYQVSDTNPFGWTDTTFLFSLQLWFSHISPLPEFPSFQPSVTWSKNFLLIYFISSPPISGQQVVALKISQIYFIVNAIIKTVTL